MLTQITHFHTDVFVENLNDCIEQNPALWLSIGIYEKEALIASLGECVYDELVSQLEYNEDIKKYVLKEDSDEKWGWLLYGRTYDYDGRKVYSCGCGCSSTNCKKISFDGIIQTYRLSDETTFERNYLAYYIYYNFKTINESVTAGSGEQIINVQNAMHVYNKKKRYNAWNRYIDWREQLANFLNHHKEHFPEANINCNLKRFNIYDV